MTFRQTEIPYHRDSTILFSHVADEAWSVFLDSGYPRKDTGRYDIIAARPFKKIVSYGNETQIIEGETVNKSSQDPFQALKEALGETVHNYSGLPFNGGAIGLFSYDLGRQIEMLPEISRHELQVPDMAIGIYDWAVIVDHHLRKSYLIAQGRDKNTAEQWQSLVRLFSSKCNQQYAEFKSCSDYRSNFTEDSYADAFTRIKQYIREGDCYQVNLAQRFDVDVEGHSWDAYLKLRDLNPAQFAAYMKLEDCDIVCSSPERFLKLESGMVETKPIKGTRRRSVFAYEDTALAQELLESEKDRAENLMIVDLLRNDIGKSCRTGSVAVPKLYDLESYATVHHLVSTVTGRLDEDKHAVELLRGCFPGGSITGAPKLRSMEIIEELEPHRRNVYCGSMGYIGFDGNMDTNITIRTLLRYQNKFYCWAGGGIVYDSIARAEYQECFDKAAAMLKLFSQQGATCG